MHEAPFLPGTNNQIRYFSLFIIVHVEAGFSQIQSHTASYQHHTTIAIYVAGYISVLNI